MAAGAGALLIGAGSFWFNNRVPIVESAARHAIPTMYSQREYDVEAGGLMSYGTSISEAFHQAGLYAGRILKGEKPGDLPVIQSTKFEFMINLKTAKLVFGGAWFACYRAATKAEHDGNRRRAIIFGIASSAVAITGFVIEDQFDIFSDDDDDDDNDDDGVN